MGEAKRRHEAMEELRKRLPTGVFIFCPCSGYQVFGNAWESSIRIAAIFGGLDIPVAPVAYTSSDISLSRNIGISIWYDAYPQLSHMLTIDNDMGFLPELVLDQIMFDQPVVGAVYPKKQNNREWVMRGSLDHAMTTKDGEFVELMGIGFGITVVKREAISELIECYPDKIQDLEKEPFGDLKDRYHCKNLYHFFDVLQRKGDNKLVSEDLSFCERWRGTGGKVWAATNHTISHVGIHGWRGNFRQEEMEKA